MKKILSLLLFVIFLKADSLDDKIVNLIGENNYKRHKNLIDIVFEDRSKFYLGLELKLNAIVKTLSNNGLLKLELETPKEINVEFHISGDGVKSLKLLNNTLRSLGYYYFFTKNINSDGNGNTTWVIRMKSSNIIDPYILSEELLKDEIKIFDIIKEDNDKWIYKIDTNFAKISESIFIDTNEKIVLQKPLKSYLLKIDTGSRIQIISRKLNHWYPYVVFYDKNLNILDVVKKSRVYRGLNLKVPKGTKYIKISDVYTLINIKRGLSVILKE